MHICNISVYDMKAERGLSEKGPVGKGGVGERGMGANTNKVHICAKMSVACEMAQWVAVPAILLVTWVQSPPHMWQFITICNSSSRGSNTLHGHQACP